MSASPGEDVKSMSNEVRQEVFTGSLPGWDRVEALVHEAHARYVEHDEGVVADYIPVLAGADPRWFGVCVAESGGGMHAAGDTDVEFSIQSISKAFVYALVCEVYGHELALERIGVNNTGMAFNSVVAVELNSALPINPMG